MTPRQPNKTESIPEWEEERDEASKILHNHHRRSNIVVQYIIVIAYRIVNRANTSEKCFRYSNRRINQSIESDDQMNLTLGLYA